MKHIVALLLALFMVLPLSLVAGATTTTGISTLSAFEKQSVATDLAGSSAGEDKFSLDKYPYEEGKTAADITIITLMEYGYNTYSSSDGRYEDYSLFLYVYNPGNVDVSKRDTRHDITMAIGSSESYKKYPLKLLSHAGDEDHDKLLLKFRVDIAAATLRELIGEKADRTYQVSEFEIAGITDTNATSHEGGKWTYSGFQAGYGSKEGTLKATVDNFEVVVVQPKAVTYRNVKNENLWQYNQLDTVYFTLPKEVVNQYGKEIVKIKYEYYKYLSGWMVGFEHEDTYELFKKYQGVLYEDDQDHFWLTAGRDIATVLFNGQYCWCYGDGPLDIMDDGHNVKFWSWLLAYVFQYDDATAKNEIIDSEEIKQFYADEWMRFCNGEESYVFSNKEEHYVGVESSPTTILESYDSSFWKALFGNSYAEEEFETVQFVEAADLNNIEENLYIAEYYSEELKQAYDAATAEGDYLVVFHFAVDDYYTASLDEHYLTGYDETGFVAREPLYMDFDMIEMTFDKEGKFVTLPVAHSPINVVSDLQLPGDDDFPPDWLVWLIVFAIIVVVIVLLVVFAPGILTAILQAIWFVLKMIVKGIVFLLRLIIKGIVALCKGIASLFQGSKKKK